ncbi:MAG: phosphoribosyltransferase family protein [Chitinophagaceae bacterium]
MTNNIILNKEEIQIKLLRLSYEVAESMNNVDSLIIIGIKENGFVIANQLHQLLKKIFKNNITIIGASLDKANPKEVIFDTEIDFNKKNVLIVDDVCNSGKTLLYTLKPLLNSFPNKIEILVLVDRIYKQFPVKPNYVGLSLATTLSDFVEVKIDGKEVLGAFVKHYQ